MTEGEREDEDARIRGTSAEARSSSRREHLEGRLPIIFGVVAATIEMAILLAVLYC